MKIDNIEYYSLEYIKKVCQEIIKEREERLGEYDNADEIVEEILNNLIKK